MEAIKVNLIPNGIPEACHVSQYDEGRQIRLDLFDGLTPYTIQAGDTFTLNVRKPDNHVITQTITGNEGNTYLIIDTTEQMTAVTGENLCEIRLENGGDNIGSLNFIMQVEKDVIANGISSESVIEDLNALVVEAVGDNYYTKTETDALIENVKDNTRIVDTASGSIAQFNTDLTDNLVKCECEFSATQAEGTPTPAAPIPIVGVDKVNITRTGKNLLGGSKLLANAQAYLPSGTTDLVNKTFEFQASATTTDGLTFTTGLKFKEDTQYTIIFVISKNAGTGTNLRVYYTDGTWNNIGTVTETNTKFTIIYKTSSSKTVASIRKTNSSNKTTLYYDECGIFEGDLSETDFEPYNGTTALINLGGTYYGGSVDCVTGKIPLTHKKYVIDENSDITWRTSSNTAVFDVDAYTKVRYGGDLLLCDTLQAVNVEGLDALSDNQIGMLNNSGDTAYSRIPFKVENITSKADMQTWLASHNITIVVNLATPIVVYASNTAEIPTIVGDNQVFCDSGNVEVEYKKSVKAYIDDKLKAIFISYDNSSSGLTATNTQTAIDELAGANRSVNPLRATAPVEESETRDEPETDEPETRGDDNEER